MSDRLIHPQEKEAYLKAFDLDDETFYFFGKKGPHYYLPLTRKIAVDALTIAGDLRVDHETLLKYLRVIHERLTEAANGEKIGSNIADSRTLVFEMLKRMTGLPSIDVIYRFAAAYLFKLEDDFSEDLSPSEIMRRIKLFQKHKKKVFLCPIIRDIFNGSARTDEDSLLYLIRQIETQSVIHRWQDSTLLAMISST